MSENWSLDNLYKGIETAEFKEDYKKAIASVEYLLEFAKNNFKTKSSKILDDFLSLRNNLTNSLLPEYYLNMHLAANSNDENAQKLLSNLEHSLSDLKIVDALFINFIKEFGLPENPSGLQKELTFYLEEMQTYCKYTLSQKEESILSKFSINGSSSFAKLRGQLVSNLECSMSLNGLTKSVPFSEIRNLAYDSDAATRKSAFDAELRAYEKIDRSIAFALNSIKGEVILDCQIRSYDSPLDKTLFDCRMDRKTLDAMWNAIISYLPKLRKFFLHKAKKLDSKNGLPFYDLFAPLGNSKEKYTYEEAQKYIVENFTKFNKELGDFASNAFEKNWIDPFPKVGKVDGAFCEYITPIKESRILSSFTGSFNDIETLAHELGHGFHNQCLVNELPLNTNYSMPIAETASIFCETIIEKAALKNASKEEQIFILDNSLTSATQVLIDIYSRFLFEDNFFKARLGGVLSVLEINELMKDAQKKAYGEYLDCNALHPYMWIAKPHYYDANYNYYNFPYAFGLLFSKGVYAEYLANSSTDYFQTIKNLLASSGKKSMYDLGKQIGIDLHDDAFWISSLKIIEEDLNLFLTL